MNKGDLIDVVAKTTCSKAEAGKAVAVLAVRMDENSPFDREIYAIFHQINSSNVVDQPSKPSRFRASNP
jgi:hypothetical protein